ncbi:DUF4124 domain-containing protein [Acinetobacter boissieri]|uniref:DUF4124 domain-containing protein n=1 Tax=Acinetobacter boissieri TaxID=1219383 RepID=A0A1G6GGS2_9GAMM|nr:DUF4124 domain-containing protein [Acinetobacter boissieri]SDB81023.1 protein of unknown function [Acinetobacter boissieri]
MTYPKKIYSALFLLLLTTAVNAQDIYKWVDAQGVTHYGQTPPQNTKKITVFKTYGQTTSSASSTLPPDQSSQKPVVGILTNSGTIQNSTTEGNSSAKLPQ